MKFTYVILLLCYLAVPSFAQDSLNISSDISDKIEWEAFPILTYDTDAGFGYGLKGYLRNIFAKKESYDIILYNSTKGERWYRFQFSYPDYEIRQGTDYGYAIDITADYDKWISYYFYGIGNNSYYDNRKIYTREPLELSFIISRTLTTSLILQAGLKFTSVKYTDFPKVLLPSGEFHNRVEKFSLLINALYDTRNSIINPSGGMSLSAGFETAPSFYSPGTKLSKAALTLQSYHKIIVNELILAERITLQELIGNNIPVQFLLPIGGNQSLRGYPQDRYLDKSFSLINAELRFLIWWRFGGIAGIDAGRVFSSLGRFSFADWRISPAAGLRFYMDNFIVRADFGFSDETIGFYFNFGHLF
jgi:outer membrane protein assembly factor BamA